MDIGYPRVSYFFVEDACGGHPPRSIYRAQHSDFDGGVGYPLFQVPEGLDGKVVADALCNAHADGHRCRATQIQVALNLR